jgi:hypothetical protein
MEIASNARLKSTTTTTYERVLYVIEIHSSRIKDIVDRALEWNHPDRPFTFAIY